MPGRIRAVAIDYDGTLASDGPPAQEVIDALAAARASGLRVVLVTGRILAELLHVFPEALGRFDMVVAENGALVASGQRQRALAPPVDVALDKALGERGIGFRRGVAILAVSGGAYDGMVFEAISASGLDCQVVRNRSELMVVPSGISKATGLAHALAELGISCHNAIAIGDAENDLAMLEACELGVAVGNAVPSLKEHADLVLTEPDGGGVVALLAGPVLRGEPPIRPRRWQVNLGRTADGGWARVPASGVDLLIVGGSGSGKSFAAGLVAEQLIGLGYTVCAIDPEGDHSGLGRLPRTAALGGGAVPPDPEDVARILGQSLTSVVVDLSLVGLPERDAWTRRTLALLEEQRVVYGLPHWLLIDEAHAPLRHAAAAATSFAPSQKGHCLVTYRPGELADATLSELDYLLLLAGEAGIDGESLDVVSVVAGVPMPELAAAAAGLGFGEALLVRAGSPPAVERLALSERWVRHVRHWHKYAAAQLPARRRFHFRHPSGAVVGVAGNLLEFRRLLHRCDLPTLERHARAGDFSRWIREVVADDPLADSIAAFEARVAQGISRVLIQDTRMAMVDAVDERYEQTA